LASLPPSAPPTRSTIHPDTHPSAQGPDNDQSIDTNIFQEHNEALALVNGPSVSTKATPAESGSVATSNGPAIKQEALQSAKELVQLHYEVKSRHVNGEVDEELRQAREDVYRVLSELG
jgi:hypothetical protein